MGWFLTCLGEKNPELFIGQWSYCTGQVKIPFTRMRAHPEKGSACAYPHRSSFISPIPQSTKEMRTAFAVDNHETSFSLRGLGRAQQTKYVDFHDVTSGLVRLPLNNIITRRVFGLLLRAAYFHSERHSVGAPALHCWLLKRYCSVSCSDSCRWGCLASELLRLSMAFAGRVSLACMHCWITFLSTPLRLLLVNIPNHSSGSENECWMLYASRNGQ